MTHPIYLSYLCIRLDLPVICVTHVCFVWMDAWPCCCISQHGMFLHFATRQQTDRTDKSVLYRGSEVEIPYTVSEISDPVMQYIM